MLYQWDMRGSSFGELVDSLNELRGSGDHAKEFAHELASGTIRRADDIDPLIEAESKSWKLDRIALVERNLLRLAIYEFMELETDKRVVIDEAVSIAKRYAAPDAVSFVNGVLDAVCKRLEASTERG